MKVNNQFVIQAMIGKGASSKVYSAIDVWTNRKVAVKILKEGKAMRKGKGVRIFETEHERMVALEGHPNILKSFYTAVKGKFNYENKLNYCVYNVIELAENGSLSSIVRRTGGLGENIAKFYFTQIWHAVAYVHSFGIAHMDIKLDNILLDEFFNVKLADFGVSLDVSATGGFADRFWGTSCYMAPEVAHLLETETYDAYKADIFSLGMWLYVMLFGEFPLNDSYDTCSLEDPDSIGWITGLKWSSEIKKQWDLISCDLQDLIGNLLSLDPDERPLLNELLEWEWLSDISDSGIVKEVYQEMENRRNFILTNPQSKLKELANFEFSYQDSYKY